jgi:two-component system, OmpR family, phosphate regulon sensor histidine kinase PhoR
MKLNQTYLFVGASSVALIILLLIQVNWILQTAKIKEEFFNEKANMVLARTAESLNADKETCKRIGETVFTANDNTATAKLGSAEVRTLDSLFNSYMRFYNFHIDYTFEVVKPNAIIADYGSGFASNAFNRRMNETATANGFQLKLIFPGKKQFILAEMGMMFITSVILILVILIMFWQTILTLLKQKRISENTTEFLNNMTHEFNTPLTNIGLAGRMIIKENIIKQEDKIKHYTGIIISENEKLKLQVEQVLGMTALEKGEIPLVKEYVDVHQMLTHCREQVSIQLETTGGIVNIEPNAANFIVNGDVKHLAGAICNLFDNAIKYSRGNPELTIETRNESHNLVLVFSDKGIGVDKQYQEKIFEKYFRVPTGNVHNVKGFGLGLAYVKKIVELHQGTMELDSASGKGTTITIRLPYAE